MMATDWSRIVFESSLRGGLALALAGVTALLLRRRSGALRHAIWLAGIVGLLVAPLASAWLPPVAMPILPRVTVHPSIERPRTSADAEIVSPSTVSTDPPIDRDALPARPPRALPSAATIAAWLWLAGAAWWMARILRAHRHVGALVREAEPVRDAGLVAAFRAALPSSGAPSTTTCRISAGIEVPLACGLVRPVVLLPASAVEWPDAVLGAVLAHELAHLRRRDPLWLALAQGIRALHWFHPLVWVAVRELRAESERACDDAVLRSGERPSRYAETLVAFAAEATPEPVAALAFWRRESLERRIGGILATHRDRQPLGRGERASVAALGLAVVVLLGILQPVPGKASRETPRAPRPESRASWSASWWTRARSVEPSTARFRNRLHSPVRIRYAEVRLVPLGSGTVGITMPELRLENRDAERRVVALLLGFDLPTTRDRSWVDVSIDPAGSTQLSLDTRQWSAVVSDEDAEELTLHVAGVRFEDGETWGIRDARRDAKPLGVPEGAPPTPEATEPPVPEVAPEAFETPAPPGWPGTPSPRAEWPKGGWPRATWPEVTWPENSWAPDDFEAPSPPKAPSGQRAPRPPTPRERGDRRSPAPQPEPRWTPTPEARPVPAEPRPDADPRPDVRGWIVADARNPEGAPAVIVEARTSPEVRVENGRPLTRLPEIVVENRSDRWIIGLRIRYKADPETHAVSGYRVNIRPHGSVFIHKDYEVWGRPEAMTVQLLGVRFDDGKIWGTMDSTIDTREPWVYPLSPEGR